jgi:hypothetical protein
METDSKRKERPMVWSLFSVGVAGDSIQKQSVRNIFGKLQGLSGIRWEFKKPEF